MNNIIGCIKNSNIFYNKLQDPENINEIRFFIKNLERNGQEQIESKITTISDIRTGLEKLKEAVFNNIKDNEKIDNLKMKMFEMEEKMSSIKNDIIFELKILLKNYYSSLKDLQFFAKKIEKWDKQANTENIKANVTSTYKAQLSNYDNPYINFQKFLSVFGGHTGGWSEHDHFLFIKERKKKKKQDYFLTTILSLLPNLTYDDVVEHEKWYVKYVELQNNVKDAIKKWKANKIIKQNYQNKTNMEQKNFKSCKELRNHSNVAEKIMEWKQQQLSKKLMKYEEQKKEEERLKVEEKKFKKIQEAKKIALNQYKLDKLKKMQIKIYQLDKTQNFESKKLNSDLIKFFRLQDMKFTEKKKILQLQLELKNKGAKGLKIAQPAINHQLLRRDPNRVLKPTLIWNLHCQTNNEKKTLVFNDINSIPHLATPEWRKDLKWK